ncbi:MFS transporter [Kitasatospora viridis]|uniref:Putative MFS family arabinose efflux permease n=1 Tax=Kitasatospora viridis TaxID=281105 RepID=A0A561UHE5_9ACTN|nr:MFS transporter [Kitasatospora viridis]TWF98773.1 putative MFS family arabinose efflux permease [Kitasatospora viridis]
MSEDPAKGTLLPMTTALRAPGAPSTLALLRQEPDFRRFLTGYATSLLGSAMAPVALAFALLREPGGADALGWVLTARILPMVLVLLLGGAAADRLGGRRVMLAADAVRCLAQAGFAAALLTGRPPLWPLLVLAAAGGVGEAVFNPALTALIPRLTPPAQLARANALLTLARSTASVAGPAAAGVLTAWAGPGTVLALDAASYAASLFALARLTVSTAPHPAGPSLLSELREGWGEFRSHGWLWAGCLHACFLNLVLWAPFLVLGPVCAAHQLGGARGWGLVMGCFGAGSVLGSLGLLRRDPRRPVLWSTVAMFGFALPPAVLAARTGLPWVCAAAVLAGLGSAVGQSLGGLALQRLVPERVRARVAAYESLGSFALGPVGLALAGPVAALLGTGTVLAAGAVGQLAVTAAVLSLRSVRTN